MVLIVPEQSQRPYRFGMTLLCVGALFNWLGLADNYSEPAPAIRYIGVGLIAAGASLICMAMCFWMRTIPDATSSMNSGTNEYSVSTDPIHIISVDITQEKPPDYATVVDIPPCYEDAIKLNPSLLSRKEETPLKSAPTFDNDYNRSFNPPASSSSDIGASEPKSATDSNHCTNNNSQQENNSSRNENSFAKVLRKSIRELRKQLKNNEECSSQQSGNTSQPTASCSDSSEQTTIAVRNYSDKTDN